MVTRIAKGVALALLVAVTFTIATPAPAEAHRIPSVSAYCSQHYGHSAVAYNRCVAHVKKFRVPYGICFRNYPAGATRDKCRRYISAHGWAKYCHAVKTLPAIHRSARIKGVSLWRSGHWREQQRVKTLVFNIGRVRKMPKPVIVAAGMTTTQEQSGRNQPYGHGSSVGAFQLIDIHGSMGRRMSLYFSANWFYNGAIRAWQRGIRDPGRIAQAVQRSSHPYAYNKWRWESERNYRIWRGKCAY